MGRPATPWTDPRVGDVCDAGDGRVRVVHLVRYRSWSGASNEPGLNRWPDHVWYEIDGDAKDCAASQWATWCRMAVRTGGKYEPVSRG